MDGIARADPDPDLEFFLHVSRAYDTRFVLAFFETMRAAGVGSPLAGLSYYPSAWGQSRYEQFDTTVEELRTRLSMKVIVAEYAFPAEPRWEGWNQPIAGYPFDQQGQADFVHDLKARVMTDPRLEGAFYWTPEETLTTADWSVMSLFLPDPSRHSPGARLALDQL